MSKYLTYVNLSDIQRLEIYVAKGSYTADKLRQRLGCDYIINGGLYTKSSMKPNCKLKVEGSVLVSTTDNYYGPAWNNPPTDLKFVLLPPSDQLKNIAYANAIACVCMKQNGVKSDMAITGADSNSQIGYKCPRTAIGKKGNQLALYVGTDSMIPSELYTYLNGQGWSDILMLDGGGSTQGYLGTGKEVTSTRKVHNYICVYTKKANAQTGKGYTAGKVNPGTIPTRAIQYGMTGNDVKWVQWQLNVHGVPCDIDGSFGPGMLDAVKSFQRSHNLSVDGSAGPDTRNRLAKSHPTACMS